MGDPLEALCAVLGDEARVCGALSGALRAERDAAIVLDADAIVASLAERRALNDELARLAATRRHLVRSLTHAFPCPDSARLPDALPCTA